MLGILLLVALLAVTVAVALAGERLASRWLLRSQGRRTHLTE
jgi:hypothetical protein